MTEKPRKMSLSAAEMLAEEAAWRAVGRPLIGQIEPRRGPIAKVSKTRRIPQMWTPVYVLDRLEEAFETLARLPMNVRPMGYKGSMPAYAYDTADLIGQVETGELERLARRRNQYRVRGATAAEVARMEQALGWPADYLSDAPEVARAVQLGALWAALRVDASKACRARQINRRAFIRRQIHGMNVIATGLMMARMPVS